MSWVESNYNIQVELRGGRRLLYNSLSRSTCILEQADVDLLSRVKRGEATEPEDTDGLDQLAQQGFVYPRDVDELSVIRALYQQTRLNPSSLALTICPTLACNF